MAGIIKLKNSAIQGAVPLITDLILGELAINSYDGKLYLKKNDGTESIIDLTTQFVTYETLLAAGDVGTGATQIAQGDHNHDSDYEPKDITILKKGDVVNDLVTGGVDVPLSAEMGKTLETNKLDIDSAPVFTGDSVTARTLDADLTLDGNGSGGVVVAGDLTVQGDLTTTISNEVEIGDSVIRLNALLDSGTAPNTDAGFEVERGSSADVSLLWDEVSDKWVVTEDGTNYFEILNSNDIGISDNEILTVDDASAASGQFPQFTANGLTALTQAQMQTALNVDVAGSDNSTDVTLVTTSHDYLSIDANQVITLGEVDIIDDTNFIAGTGVVFLGTTLNVSYGTSAGTALEGNSGISDLSDVDTTGGNENDVLTLDNAGNWVPSATAVTYSGWSISDGTNTENVDSGSTVEYSSTTPSFLTIGYNTTSNVMDFAINTGTTGTTLALGNHTHALGDLTDVTETLAGDDSDDGLMLVYNSSTDKWESTDTIDGGTY